MAGSALASCQSVSEYLNDSFRSWVLVSEDLRAWYPPYSLGDWGGSMDVSCLVSECRFPVEGDPALDFDYAERFIMPVLKSLRDLVPGAYAGFQCMSRSHFATFR